MSLEDFPGRSGEKLEIRLNSAQLELEAWAELGKNTKNMQQTFSSSIIFNFQHKKRAKLVKTWIPKTLKKHYDSYVIVMLGGFYHFTPHM